MQEQRKNSLLKNGIYNVLGGLARILLGIAMIPVLIRSLGMEEYGLWTLASSILGVVTLAEAGLSTATTVFVSQDLSKNDFDSLSETISVSSVAMFILATASSSLLYFSSGLIIHWYPGLSIPQSTVLFHSLKIGGLIVWLRLFQQVLIGIEQAYQRYDIINVVGTISSTLTSFGMILIVLLSGKTLVLMQYQFFISAFFLVIHFFVVQRLIGRVNIKFNFTLSKFITMGKYSIMMWITSIGGVLFSRVDRLVIASVIGSKELGIYAAITDISSQINILSAMAVQPLVSLLSGEVDIMSSSVKEKVKKSLFINLYISLMLGIIIITLSPFILGILLKQPPSEIRHDYLTSFKLGVLIYSLYSVNGSSYYVLLGTKNVKQCSTISLLVGILSVALIYTGATHMGLVGAIIGNAGFLGVYAFTFSAMTILRITFKEYLKELSYPIVCLLTFSAISLFTELPLFINICLSSISLTSISILVRNSIFHLDLITDP
jgi:O-antigen/teichoic acid export membrane protein